VRKGLTLSSLPYEKGGEAIELISAFVIKHFIGISLPRFYFVVEVEEQKVWVYTTAPSLSLGEG